MPAVFEAAHSEQVKTWLTKELGPICDAEPDVLADYIIALLKHDGTEAELSALLNEQLSDFLDDKTTDFVTRLVSTLSSKSYLPQQAASPSASGSTRKRAADDEGPRRTPPKNPRSSDVDSSIPRGPAAERNSAADGSGEKSERDGIQKGSKGGAAGQVKQPCRDFHNKGWCSRGRNCRFEHSTDAIDSSAGNFPGMSQQQQQQQQQQQHQRGMPGGPGGPGQFNAGMNGGFMGARPPPGMPMGFPMHFPPQQMWNGQMAPQQGQFQYPGAGSPPPQGQGSDGMNLAMRMGEQQPPQGMFSQSGSMPPPGLQADGVPPQRGSGFGDGAGRGRGRGRGGGPSGQFQSRARSNTTLVIENVPADNLDLIKINDYFKRFGTITNIQIDAPGAKALVSYSDHAEAKAAHDSPDVIFGNRFVKVFFQRLDDPVNGAGPSRPKAGGPRPPSATQTFAAGQNVYRPPGAATAGGPEGGSSTPTSSSSGLTPEQMAERKSALEAQKAAQDKVNQLMTEQKQTLVKVTSTTVTTEEKKAGMARLRTLEPQIKEATEEVRKAVQAIAALPAPAAPTTSYDPSKRYEQREKVAREQLDRELEAHSTGQGVATTVENAPEGSTGDAPSGQTAQLRAKLESLKAEAAALGLDQSGSGTGGRGGYAGYRGRGRGGNPAYRGGRGGAAGAGPSMRLDNRSTKLNVSDVPEGKDPQKVKEWLKSFGDVSSFDDDVPSPSIFSVTFKQRHAAESAVRSLVSSADYEVPDVGRVKLIWAPAPPVEASKSTTAASSSGDGGDIEGGQAAVSANTNVAAAGAEGDNGDAEDDNWKR